MMVKVKMQKILVYHFLPFHAFEPILCKNWKPTEEPSHPKASVSQWEMYSETSSSHSVSKDFVTCKKSCSWHGGGKTYYLLCISNLILKALTGKNKGHFLFELYIWVLSLHISYFLALLCIEVFPTVKVMNINTALGNEHYVTLPYKHSKEQIITQRVIVCLGCFCSDLRGDVDSGYENNYAPVLPLQAIRCLVPHNYLPLTYLESAFATSELFT